MNTETNNRPVRKAAAVIGFVALLVLIAWLSITIVKNVPGSFASLASLAESVRGFDTVQNRSGASDDEATQDDTDFENMLIVTSDTNVVETDNSVRLAWTDASTQGSFTFTYACVDGVAMRIVEDGGVREIDCDTNYNVGNINSLTLDVTSKEARFVDVAYTLAFLETEATTPSAATDAVLTIVNEDIDLIAIDTTEPSEAVVATTETPVTETPTTEAIPEEPVTTTPVETEPVTPSTPVTTPVEEFTQEFTFTIPVSDPNGRIDLATRFLDTGRISNNAFIPGTVERNEAGAIQFEVKNLGSKTSEEWTYTVSLPAGGMISSDDQAPLKPNERAVITIGFPAADVASFDFLVVIDTDEETTSINNGINQTVTFE